MRKIKLFLSLLMLIAFSVGNVWAETATITFANEGLDNGVQYTDPFAFDDSNITVTFAGGGNDGKYYDTGSGIRTYGGGSFTVATASGTITAATFTWDGNNKPSTNVADKGTYNNGSWSGSASSFTLTRPSGSGHWRLKSISVTYTPDGGGSDPIAVSEVTLDEDEIALEVGEKQTLTATVSPDNATNKNVTWESDDTEVATVENGLVTAVAPGTATITCKSADDATKSATCDVTVTAAEVPTLTFDFSAKGYENGVQYPSIIADANITISFGDGDNDGKYYNTGTAMRVYGGGHMTVAGKEGVTISKILLEFGSGEGSNEISTEDGTYAAGKWTGSEQSVTFNVGGTSGHRRIKVVKVFYEVEAVAVTKPTISAEDNNFLNSTTVTISHDDADAIYYTTNGDDPTVNNDLLYSAPFSLYNTATVKAIAVKGGVSSAVAEETFTKVTVLSVAQAKAAIAAAGTTPIENQYVGGVISQIDSYDGTHHSITYWISADGTTSNQLEVYSGKGLNGASFAGLSDLSLGDEVVVKGTLKNYKGTDEFDMNSHIIQLNRTIAAPTFNPNGGGFLTTLSVVITSATENAEVRYTIDGSDPTATSTLYENPIELSATTTIKAAAFQGEYVSAIVTKTFTKGSKITVAAALEALDSNSPIENQFVYGKVSTAPTSNPSSGRLTYYISDNGSTTDQLQVYNGYGLNGASFAEKTDLQVGDEVTIYGTLKIFNEKKEFDGGNYLLEFNRPVAQTFSTTYVENDANEDIEDVAAATNLPDPLPTVTKNEKIFGGWFTTSTFEVGSEAVAGAPLSKDETLYAKWNDLSPWASVYTSNVEIASNTAAHVTINGEDYDAAKTSKGASATITLPQGVTAIHLHLVAWNGEAQTVSVTGDCFNEAKELAIEANAGVSGQGTTYDLGESGTDYYFSLTPDNEVAANTVITIAAEGQKRFVLFGVNQEGGVLPVLDHIAITGTMTNTTGWKTGDNIVPEGLTVNAIYTLNNVEQTPVEVDPNDVVWSHAALVENQTEVTLTATYEGKNANKVVTIGAVETGDPTIITDPTTYLNFGSSVEKDAVVASKTITVTLKNITSATATLGGETGDDYSAFSIDDTEIVDGDVITVSVNTGTVGVYAGTVTIKDDNSETQKVITLSMTVVEPETPEEAVSTTSQWVAATAADLVDGAEVLITGVKADVTYAMGVQNNNNRAAVEASVDGEGVLTPGTNTMSFILVEQGEGKFALRTSNGKYLYAASSSSNYLRSQDAVDGNAKWTISASSAVANGNYTHKMMQFNSDGNGLFSCYTTSTTTQKPIAFYVPKPVTPPTPVYETVREGLTAGNYYTICFNRTMEAVQGATFWTFASKDANMAYLVQEDAPYAAGTPYIIYAEAAGDLTAVLSGDVETTPGVNGALHGTFSLMEQTHLNAAGENIYLLMNNELRRVDGRSDNSLPAYRAYIDLDEIANTGAPANVPAHRVRAIPMHKDVVTGFENINATDKPVKLLIDGNIYILRGEKMYDATGRLVK